MTIDKLVEAFSTFKRTSDEFQKMFEVFQKFSDSQFIYWYSFEDEDSEYIINQENTNVFLAEWYEEGGRIHLDEAIEGIDNHQLIKPNKVLWEESKTAFQSCMYNLVLRGLFPIADQMFTDSSGFCPRNIKYVTEKDKVLEIDKSKYITTAERKEFLVTTYFTSSFNLPTSDTDEVKLKHIINQLKNKKQFPDDIDLNKINEDEKVEEIWHQLFDYPQNYHSTKRERAEIIVANLGESKEPKNVKYPFDLNALYYTYNYSKDSFFENSDFSGNEPTKLNRHWILHGRSKHIATKLDCIKLINLIYSLCLIYDYNKTIK